MTRGPENDPFDALVSAEREGLFRFLYWSLGDREDALDGVQDTLLRAYRSFETLRDPSRARNWLYVIAANVARRLRAKRGRAPRTFGLQPDEGARTAPHAAAPSPSANLEADEARDRLSEAVASLAPELREPLLMFVVSGLKYREIADALGWPIGTVTTRIHVARETLAARLRKRD